ILIAFAGIESVGAEEAGAASGNSAATLARQSDTAPRRAFTVVTATRVSVVCLLDSKTQRTHLICSLLRPLVLTTLRNGQF
ncbi:jg27229, partial [Pararge aegeria aegeria]